MDRPRFYLSRRRFLPLAGAAMVAALAAACGVPMPTVSPAEPSEVPKELFVTPELAELGNELEAWTLANGYPMVAISEIQAAANLLKGDIDPHSLFPYAQIPLMLEITTEEQSGGLNFGTMLFDLDRPEKITVIDDQNGQVEFGYIVNQVPLTFFLNSTVFGSDQRFPMIAKEASQLIDHPAYRRLFLQIMQRVGLKEWSPKDIPSVDEVETSLAMNILAIQERDRGSSLLGQLIDYGSHIRVGGIAYANWLFDYITRTGQKPPEDDPFSTWGIFAGGTLQERGLIAQRDGTDEFHWTKGGPPAIGSQEFLDLFNELSGLSIESQRYAGLEIAQSLLIRTVHGELSLAAASPCRVGTHASIALQLAHLATLHSLLSAS